MMSRHEIGTVMSLLYNVYLNTSAFTFNVDREAGKTEEYYHRCIQNVSTERAKIYFQPLTDISNENIPA